MFRVKEGDRELLLGFCVVPEIKMVPEIKTRRRISLDLLNELKN